MTMTTTAPVATAEDRNAISWLITLLRPDWDRKGIESALAKHADQNLDVLAVQAIIAAVTRTDQKTPAVLGLDGDHTARARVALSRPARTTQPLSGAELGGECGVCGVRQAMHAGVRASLEHGIHAWTPAPPTPPANPAHIAALNPFNRQEQHA